jgi:hypothetical protein
MRKPLSLIILSFLFLAACQKSELSTETPMVELATYANTSVNNNGSENVQNVPVNDIFYNECCNEEVYVTGTASLVINKNIMHLVVKELNGVGLTSGFNYSSHIPSVLSNVFYSNPNEGMFTFMLNMSNNDGCSFRVKATYRLNLNANGDVVVSFQNMESICFP